MTNIWQTLKKPILILAPMEEVTDTVFRQIIIGCGRPSLFFTEFTNVDGILSKGKKVVSQRLQFLPIEKPIIAQIWGTNPEYFYQASQLLVQMDFDGIDINMGCPQRDVIKNGACGNLINNPALATEIIDAFKKGVDGKLPVSVKTRIGVKEVQTEKWIGHLLEQNLDGLTIHGRTVKEMSKFPARWDEVKLAVELRNQMKKPTIIIGNGDVKSYRDAEQKISESGADGAMIDRGVFSNPWIFNKDINIENITPAQRIDLLLKHTRLFQATWGEQGQRVKNFQILKKFYNLPKASVHHIIRPAWLKQSHPICLMITVCSKCKKLVDRNPSRRLRRKLYEILIVQACEDDVTLCDHDVEVLLR